LLASLLAVVAVVAIGVAEARPSFVDIVQQAVVRFGTEVCYPI
jgi:hypothetical protein